MLLTGLLQIFAEQLMPAVKDLFQQFFIFHPYQVARNMLACSKYFINRRGIPNCKFVSTSEKASTADHHGRVFIYLPAFLDTSLPRGNVHERDSGPM